MADPFAGAFKALEYFDAEAIDLKGPASPADIEAAESALGVGLPWSYCEFLKRHNGGRLPGEFVYGVPPNERHLDTVELTLFERGNTDGFPPGLVVLRPDGRGNYFCLDTQQLGEDAECPVVFWQWRESFVSAPIATSFERFFELLCTVLPKYYEEDGDPKRGVEEEAWHTDLDYIRSLDPGIDALRASWPDRSSSS